MAHPAGGRRLALGTKGLLTKDGPVVEITMGEEKAYLTLSAANTFAHQLIQVAAILQVRSEMQKQEDPGGSDSD